MAQPRPMSTPIFDELLREFKIRMEEQRGLPPEQADPPPPPQNAVPQPAGPPANQTAQAVNHRHRAE